MTKDLHRFKTTHNLMLLCTFRGDVRSIPRSEDVGDPQLRSGKVPLVYATQPLNSTQQTTGYDLESLCSEVS
jgi:hypothetical protein